MSLDELATMLALVKAVLADRGAVTRVLSEFFDYGNRVELLAGMQTTTALSAAGFYDVNGPALHRAIVRAILVAESPTR